MSNWTPTTYKTKNWSDYNRALKQRGSLSIWFDAEMAWAAKPSGHRGR
ncbi:MAG: IS5/IS1182 family transposase, partial [Rhodobacteraceae bacterium]|nr:IS5/IS1182 family transposase [Paracoccaceae bacterium]